MPLVKINFLRNLREKIASGAESGARVSRTVIVQQMLGKTHIILEN
jgi:hypothetical protein